LSAGPSPSWETLSLRLGYTFSRPELLALAFVHESQVNEGLAEVSNERLEFLGDSVVGLVVAEYLYRNYSQHAEGQLAQMKSYLVSKKHLALCAHRLGLGDYLQLGKGEETSGGKRRDSLLANSLEAVLGAVFLDGGFNQARRAILGFLAEDMDRGMGSLKDAKSRLQERVQTVFSALPDYRVVGEEGPSHSPHFEVEVLLAGELLGRGSGPSKREASQLAAQAAIKLLKQRGEGWFEPFLGKLPRSGPCGRQEG
jgi:ribonuclease-3